LSSNIISQPGVPEKSFVTHRIIMNMKSMATHTSLQLQTRNYLWN
jgi:hypothetical protein